MGYMSSDRQTDRGIELRGTSWGHLVQYDNISPISSLMDFPFLLLLMAVLSSETAKDSNLGLPQAVSDTSSLSLPLKADLFFNHKTLPVSCFLYPASYAFHLINTHSLPLSAVDVKTKIISFFIPVDFCVIENVTMFPFSPSFPLF